MNETQIKLQSFISEAPRYSDPLAFTTGILSPSLAKERIIKPILSEIEQIPKTEWNKRIAWIECVVQCCVELEYDDSTRKIVYPVVDRVGQIIVKQMVCTQPVSLRRELARYLIQSAHAHHDAQAFRKNLRLIQALARTGVLDDPTQFPMLPDDILPGRERRVFFASPSMVELLGFIGIPDADVIDTLIAHFEAPATLQPGWFEFYAWRAIEALASLDWAEVSLSRLKKWVARVGPSRKWITKAYFPKIVAYGWHAIAALGHSDAVDWLQSELKPELERELKDCLDGAPELFKRIRADLNNPELGLREVLLDFVSSQDKAERWCPLFLAQLAGVTLDEVLERVFSQEKKRLLENRWKAAELLIKSNLPEKYYPLERFLLDYKNYFFEGWSEGVAGELKEMAQGGKSPQKVLKAVLKKLLSIDRERVLNRFGCTTDDLSAIGSLSSEDIKSAIHSIITDGQLRLPEGTSPDRANRTGSTWSTLVLLGAPFKMVSSIEELRQFRDEEEGRIKEATGPVDTYPRDFFARMLREKEIEEAQKI